jgi:hypothetical protein
MGSAHLLPDNLKPFYGATPTSFLLFTRVMLR